MVNRESRFFLVIPTIIFHSRAFSSLPGPSLNLSSIGLWTVSSRRLWVVFLDKVPFFSPASTRVIWACLSEIETLAWCYENIKFQYLYLFIKINIIIIKKTKKTTIILGKMDPISWKATTYSPYIQYWQSRSPVKVSNSFVKHDSFAWSPLVLEGHTTQLFRPAAFDLLRRRVWRGHVRSSWGWRKSFLEVLENT